MRGSCAKGPPRDQDPDDSKPAPRAQVYFVDAELTHLLPTCADWLRFRSKAKRLVANAHRPASPSSLALPQGALCPLQLTARLEPTPSQGPTTASKLWKLTLCPRGSSFPFHLSWIPFDQPLPERLQPPPVTERPPFSHILVDLSWLAGTSHRPPTVEPLALRLLQRFHTRAPTSSPQIWFCGSVGEGHWPQATPFSVAGKGTPRVVASHPLSVLLTQPQLLSTTLVLVVVPTPIQGYAQWTEWVLHHKASANKQSGLLWMYLSFASPLQAPQDRRTPRPKQLPALPSSPTGLSQVWSSLTLGGRQQLLPEPVSTERLAAAVRDWLNQSWRFPKGTKAPEAKSVQNAVGLKRQLRSLYLDNRLDPTQLRFFAVINHFLSEVAQGQSCRNSESPARDTTGDKRAAPTSDSGLHTEFQERIDSALPPCVIGVQGVWSQGLWSALQSFANESGLTALSRTLFAMPLFQLALATLVHLDASRLVSSRFEVLPLLFLQLLDLELLEPASPWVAPFVQECQLRAVRRVLQQAQVQCVLSLVPWLTADALRPLALLHSFARGSHLEPSAPAAGASSEPEMRRQVDDWATNQKRVAVVVLGKPWVVASKENPGGDLAVKMRQWSLLAQSLKLPEFLNFTTRDSRAEPLRHAQPPLVLL